MKSENQILQWFRNNWFLLVFLIVAYVVLRLAGYDVAIIKSDSHIQKKEAPTGKYDNL